MGLSVPCAVFLAQRRSFINSAMRWTRVESRSPVALNLSALALLCLWRRCWQPRERARAGCGCAPAAPGPCTRCWAGQSCHGGSARARSPLGPAADGAGRAARAAPGTGVMLMWCCCACMCCERDLCEPAKVRRWGSTTGTALVVLLGCFI